MEMLKFSICRLPGRVMTGTAKGDSGTSYGWINYDLINTDDSDNSLK